jgi:hypothetical protein
MVKIFTVAARLCCLVVSCVAVVLLLTITPATDAFPTTPNRWCGGSAPVMETMSTSASDQIKASLLSAALLLSSPALIALPAIAFVAVPPLQQRPQVQLTVAAAQQASRTAPQQHPSTIQEFLQHGYTRDELQIYRIPPQCNEGTLMMERWDLDVPGVDRVHQESSQLQGGRTLLSPQNGGDTSLSSTVPWKDSAAALSWRLTDKPSNLHDLAGYVFAYGYIAAFTIFYDILYRNTQQQRNGRE